MSVNTSIGLVALAKQTAKGVPAASPTFSHGLTGGKVFNVDRGVEAANVACGIRANTDSYVSEVSVGLDYEFYPYADAFPLYAAAAMGNITSAAAEGKTGFFKHTVTIGSTLPYLTLWGQIGADNIQRVDDAKLDTLSISFEGNAPLDIGATFMGCDALMGIATWPGKDPSCFDGYFVPTGGTFKLDTNGSVPKNETVLSGSLELANNCEEYRAAGRAMADDVAEGKLTSSGSVTVLVQDLKAYRKLVTGTETGTAISSAMVYGSFDWRFEHSKDPDLKLTITAHRVPFTAEFPDVDPEGGAAEMEFSFDDIALESAVDSPVTIEVINKVATYN